MFDDSAADAETDGAITEGVRDALLAALALLFALSDDEADLRVTIETRLEGWLFVLCCTLFATSTVRFTRRTGVALCGVRGVLWGVCVTDGVCVERDERVEGAVGAVRGVWAARGAVAGRAG